MISIYHVVVLFIVCCFAEWFLFGRSAWGPGLQRGSQIAVGLVFVLVLLEFLGVTHIFRHG